MKHKLLQTISTYYNEPGLQISNVELNNKSFTVQFDLEAYDGAIDLTVELSYPECKAFAMLEKKLLGMIKYRKRKYEIH